MRRFLLPIASRLNENSLRGLYARVSASVSRQSGRDAKSVMENVLGALRTFFGRLGKPRFYHREYLRDDPLKPVEFRAKLLDIADDVRDGYGEVLALRDAAITAHNYGAVHVGELRRRSDEVASRVADLRLVSGQQVSEVVVFSDSFVDDSKMDAGLQDGLDAQILPGQGSLTLHRMSARTIGPDEVDIAVNPIGSYLRDASSDNEGRFYEGHFYSFLGSAEPEGGALHLQERMIPGSTNGLDQSSYKLPDLSGLTGAARKDAVKKWAHDFIVPGGAEASLIEQVQSGAFNFKLAGDFKGNEAAFKEWFFGKLEWAKRKDAVLRKQWLYWAEHPDEAAKAGVDLSPDVPLGPENFYVVDAGGNADELQIQRKKMMDGDPASYWQCEVVRSTKVFQDYLKQNQQEAEAGIEVTAAKLRELARGSDVDKEDVEVEIVVVLSSAQTLNWITLDPMIFDDGAFLEVTDVSTASDMEAPFEVVDSFGSTPLLLAEDVNAEVPDDVATTLLAPSRLSFRGQGVWTFPARNVRRVRVRIKQRTPVPNPFERTVIETERVISNKNI